MRWAMARSSSETEPLAALAVAGREVPEEVCAIAGMGANNAIANSMRRLLDN
jgi:hypothetical protein